MNKWIHERMNDYRMTQFMNKWMNQTVERMNEWSGDWVNEWIYAMDEWIH